MIFSIVQLLILSIMTNVIVYTYAQELNDSGYQTRINLLDSQIKLSLLDDQKKDLRYDPNSILRGKELNEKAMTTRSNKNIRGFPVVEFWPFDDLKIQGDLNDCLFFLPESSKCIYTLGYFNSALAIMKQPKKISITKARENVLRKLLVNFYRKHLSVSAGLDSNNDFKTRTSDFIINDSINHELFLYGVPIRDSVMLLETYKKYYDKYFSNKKFKKIELIGSSDSDFVDSVYLLLKKNEQLNSKLPFIKTVDTMLIDELQCKLDSVNINDLKLIKTKFGFFIIRITDILERKEKKFNEVRNQLITLTSKDYYRNSDSIVEEKAYQYYRKNKEVLSNTDTFDIQTWLIPVVEKDTIHLESYLLTGKYKYININSHNLPENIKTAFVSRYLEKNDTVIGPLNSIYGIWFFKINRIRKSKKTVSFYSIKDQLINGITEEADSIPEEHKKQLAYDNAVASLYQQNFYDYVTWAESKQIVRFASDYNIRINSNEILNDEKINELRKRIITEAKNKDKSIIENWMKMISY